MDVKKIQELLIIQKNKQKTYKEHTNNIQKTYKKHFQKIGKKKVETLYLKMK
jgi:uncharacterized protein YcnI